MVNELKQLVDKDVFEVVRASRLSPQERKAVLRSFMFFKEKYFPDGSFDKLKARFVAGGHMQDRELAGDISSPTVSLPSVMMVAAIAKKEQRKVVTMDIAGAYLNAPMGDRVVHLKLDSTMAGILSKFDPAYRDCMQPDGSVIVRLKKALYGCIESAKLWYEVLSSSLREFGLTPNPKDPCVFNKQCDKSGKQITVLVYVDDLMVTSTDEEEINNLIAHLEAKFKSLTKSHGNVHSYLGMTFDFGDDRGLVVTMSGFEEDLMRHYNVQGVAASPATNDLFDVDTDSPLLSPDEAFEFRSAVAKLLYESKRASPDLLTAVSILSTRVTCPTEQDAKKLNRVMRYKNTSMNKGIILTVNDDMTPIADVDASFGVHPDRKSHSGIYISLGLGPIFVQSVKQRLVTKSSTEAELVALSDALGQIIWTREFLRHQGYDIGPVIIHQDNKSTMALVERGRSNASGTRHIDIRYFFVKDRVSSGEVKIVYKATNEIKADFFTKPLQGTVFRQKTATLRNWYD
jgi:hypothetical protein